jgi:hypothetical protein
LIEQTLSPSAIEASFRRTIAEAAALALVSLPIWMIHWQAAQRFAQRDAWERGSTLRRLYVYGVSAVLLLMSSIFVGQVLDNLLLFMLRDPTAEGVRTVRAGWQMGLAVAFWAYHFRTAALDRQAVGETGGSATLRRWYIYLAIVVSTIVLLFATRELLSLVAFRMIDGQPSTARHVASTIAAAVIGLIVLLFHARWIALAQIIAEDRRSTLRAVAGFGIVALCVVAVLSEASRALYYGLARLMGVERPGGQGGDLAGLLVMPVATVLVFGAAWVLTRRALIRDAAESEAPRQAGVRRLYSHLVAFAALVAFTAGVGGILWTLVDVTTSQPAPIDPKAYRDMASLSLTLILVGLPMWLLHWTAAPASAERMALSRRLYLFAAILVGVLTVLGSGAYMVQRLLALVLGVGSAAPWSEIGRAASASIVAAAVVAYHWRIMRLDNQERAELRAASVPAAPAEGATAIVVRIVGATEADVRGALAALPAAASYSFEPPLGSVSTSSPD